MKFTDKDGRKREALSKNCEYCKVEFITRAGQPAKTCSLTCSNKAREKKTEVICSNCQTKFLKKPAHLRNSKSGLYFCSRKCKDRAQRIGGVKEIQPPHYGTSLKDYRSFFEDQDFFCHRCKYNEFKIAVEIHHIDGNHENNDKSNLIPLCRNCHRALHSGYWELSGHSSNRKTSDLQSEDLGAIPKCVH